MVRWLLIVCVVAGLGTGAWFYFNKTKDTVPELRTATVTRGDLTQAVTANGQLTPVINVEVGSQVSGTIEKILVDFNSKVTNGQIIAQIDPSTHESNLLQAEAELANAKASLALQQVESRRAEELHKGGLISKSEYDKSLADLQQAEAMVKVREASRRRAKTDVERTTIYAPIDGVVISRSIEVGQTVAASFNTPKLFQIANDLSKMEIEAMVSEADVGGVEEGQKVQFTVDAFPSRRFEGVVKQVRFAPTTNQNVVTYTTVVSVNNDDLKLRPGMTANASIITAERAGALRIPNSALRIRPPEGVTIVGQTNRADSTNGASASARPAGSGGLSAGLPTPPWTAEGRRPTPEEREKYEASLTPEQREQYRQIRERMRARFAEGGGAGGPGGGFGSSAAGARASQENPSQATVYVLEKGTNSLAASKPVLKSVNVRLGITDGAFTEVLSGLQESEVVVTGVARTESATTPAGARPGSSPFGGPFGPRRF